MKLGIVGLPNVGKSTLFNSLTKAGAESANYPFCTIDPNVGVVAVPDDRLDKLAALYNSAKITPAVIEFVDIAGLVKGASKGEGLGNQFLANIREVDAIVHVVRCFEDSNIVHVDGSIDPIRDIETINLELIFSDIEVLDRRLAKQKRASYNNKDIAKECDLLERLKAFLEEGNLAKNFECQDEDEEAFLKEYNLLTAKPVIFAANVSEDDLANDGADNEYVARVREYSKKDNCEVFVICAQIEQEISELDDDEKKMFLEDLGISSSGLDKLIAASFAFEGGLFFSKPITDWMEIPGNKIMCHEFVVVDMEYRGNGIQKRFMDATIREARQMGYDTIWCCAHPNNTPSVCSIESTGYKFADQFVVDGWPRNVYYRSTSIQR